MTRNEFITSLSARLQGIPGTERQKALDWYSELICDRMEEMPEADAVSGIGSVDEIADEILSQYRQNTTAVHSSDGTEPQSRRSPDKGVNTALVIFAAAVLSPIWLPLLIVGLSLALVAVVIVWCAVVTVGVMLVSAAAVGVVGLFYGFWAMFVINPAYGLLVLGTALIAAGLTLALIPLIVVTVKGAVRFTVWSVRKICELFDRKGKQQ